MGTKSQSGNLLSFFSQLLGDSGEDDAGSPHITPRPPQNTYEPTAQEQLIRKRQNDATRMQELDQLRTILQKDRGDPSEDSTGQPSIDYHAKVQAPPLTKKSTSLDQVQGAEVQLGGWWGKTSAAAPAAPAPLRKSRGAALDSHFDEAETQKPPIAEEGDFDLDFTTALTPEPAPVPRPITAPKAEPVQVPAPEPLAAKVSAAPPPNPVDICLRDAARLVAEGAFLEAQLLLKEMLSSEAIDTQSAELLSNCLLDVYRKTGQREDFDNLALDYAQRFGRSASEWHTSSGDTSSVLQVTSPNSRSDVPLQVNQVWVCPEVFDDVALDELVSFASEKRTQCEIDWKALRQITPGVAPRWIKQLQTWADRRLELRWSGMPALLDATQICKSGRAVQTNAKTCAEWWLIHLELLCLLQDPELFESTALDYCVQFEVSPPSWRTVQCTLMHDMPPAKSPSS
jgi:hypothetical protein